MKSKKACYTLDQKVIDILNEMSFVEKKSKSLCMVDCIKRAYGSMLEDYYENDKKPYNYLHWAGLKHKKFDIRQPQIYQKAVEFFVLEA